MSAVQGWYPDPADTASGKQRYWDGAGWGAQLRDPAETSLAGWHRDPRDPSGLKLRYYDGTTWSEQTRDVVDPSPEQAAPSPQNPSHTPNMDPSLEPEPLMPPEWYLDPWDPTRTKRRYWDGFAWTARVVSQDAGVEHAPTSTALVPLNPTFTDPLSTPITTETLETEQVQNTMPKVPLLGRFTALPRRTKLIAGGCVLLLLIAILTSGGGSKPTAETTSTKSGVAGDVKSATTQGLIEVTNLLATAGLITPTDGTLWAAVQAQQPIAAAGGLTLKVTAGITAGANSTTGVVVVEDKTSSRPTCVGIDAATTRAAVINGAACITAARTAH